MSVKERESAARYKLSKQEVLALIDREAKKRLNMSGEEFLEKLRKGALPESVAKRDIAMLASLIDEN